jgi:hypothetical protein
MLEAFKMLEFATWIIFKNSFAKLCMDPCLSIIERKLKEKETGTVPSNVCENMCVSVCVY